MYQVQMQFIPGSDSIWVAHLTPEDPIYDYDNEAEAQAKAEEYASPLLRAAGSGARLVSAGAFQNERYLTGVEIQLDPRTITYWRQPGESGAPPNFNFSKSTNVAKVEIFFPYPKHIAEADVVVVGYEGNVIFPVRILPKDPKIPITLYL